MVVPSTTAFNLTLIAPDINDPHYAHLPQTVGDVSRTMAVAYDEFCFNQLGGATYLEELEVDVCYAMWEDIGRCRGDTDGLSTRALRGVTRVRAVWDSEELRAQFSKIPPENSVAQQHFNCMVDLAEASGLECIETTNMGVSRSYTFKRQEIFDLSNNARCRTVPVVTDEFLGFPCGSIQECVELAVGFSDEDKLHATSLLTSILDGGGGDQVGKKEMVYRNTRIIDADVVDNEVEYHRGNGAVMELCVDPDEIDPRTGQPYTEYPCASDLIPNPRVVADQWKNFPISLALIGLSSFRNPEDYAIYKATGIKPSYRSGLSSGNDVSHPNTHRVKYDFGWTPKSSVTEGWTYSGNDWQVSFVNSQNRDCSSFEAPFCLYQQACSAEQLVKNYRFETYAAADGFGDSSSGRANALRAAGVIEQLIRGYGLFPELCMLNPSTGELEQTVPEFYSWKRKVPLEDPDVEFIVDENELYPEYITCDALYDDKDGLHPKRLCSEEVSKSTYLPTVTNGELEHAQCSWEYGSRTVTVNLVQANELSASGIKVSAGDSEVKNSDFRYEGFAFIRNFLP